MDGKWLKTDTIVSIPRALFRAVEQHPNRIALDYADKKFFTYKEVGMWVERLSEVFKNLMAQTDGERIALLMPNIPQFVFGYYGALLAHCIAVPINFSSVAKALKEKKPVKEIEITDEIIAQIADAAPKVIVAADFFWPILERMYPDLKDTALVFTGPQDFLPFPWKQLYSLKAKKEGKWVKVPRRDNIFLLKELLKKTPASHYLCSVHKQFPAIDQAAQLQYTGGTTGIPKGAILTHRNVTANVWQCREHLDGFLEDGAVVLGVLPFFHIYGLTACLNMTLLACHGTLICVPSFNAREAVRLTQKKNVTVFPGVNRMFQVIAETPGVPRLSSLRLCISGAGKLDLLVKEKFERVTGARVAEGYGLSEASPVVSVTLPGDNRPGSIGLPLPDTKVKIVDFETGEEVVPHQEGEIVVSGPQVMLGYYNKPDETAAVLKGGWLHTGDAGYKDKDGFLYFTGREKEMSKILGENVYWLDVERHFLSDAIVKKCAVIGVSHERTGEILVVFAVLNNGVSDNDARLLRSLRRARNKGWLIQEIVKVDETVFAEWEDVIGKVKKKKIKEYYQKMRAA